MWWRLFWAALPLLVGGCASTQLNYNTMDIASKVQSLQSRQVLYNISKFIDEPYAIPDQVIVASSGVSTTNSLTGNLAETVTKSNVIAASLSLTRVLAKNISGAGSDASTQSYTVLLINDGDNLRRLRALYQFAVYGDIRILREYPPHAANSTLEDSMHKVLLRNGHPNKRLCANWIYYTGADAAGRERPVPPDMTPIRLGSYGGHVLYTTVEQDGEKCLSDFMLFILDAAGVTAGGTLGKGGGGGGPKVLLLPEATPPSGLTPDQLMPLR